MAWLILRKISFCPRWVFSELDPIVFAEPSLERIGVAVGAGVAVDTGVAVGAGVAVDTGVAVGAGMAIDTGVAVGNGTMAVVRESAGAVSFFGSDRHPYPTNNTRNIKKNI